jgi:MoaA/NifB/PqqE/SkfB family radical SAM enzyme
MPGAFTTAMRALDAFNGAGILTYLNVCLQRDLVRGDGLYEMLDLARAMGVGAIQLLDPKPCGRYAGMNPSDLLTEVDRAMVMRFFKKTNQEDAYSGYPAVVYPTYFERAENFGCMMGGISQLAIDSSGNVNPCVFVPVSFGNIAREPIDEILKRMRSSMNGPVYKDCAANLLAPAIARERESGCGPFVPFDNVRAEWEGLIRAR